MSRSRWPFVLASVLVVVAACSRSGGGGTDAEVSPVTSPDDPLGAVKTFEPTTTTTTTSTIAAPSTTVITTAPRPDNPRGRALFVSLEGNDEQDGSWTKPFRTIARGIAAATPGDTIFVRAGTYKDPSDESMVMLRNKNGTADAWITLAGYPGERPVIDGSGWDPKYALWRVVGVQQSSYIEIRGFEIVGTAKSDQQPSSGIELLDSHHVRVSDNRIHDVGGGGFSSIFSNHFDVVNNVIWSTSFWNTYQTSGISSFQSKNIGGGNDADGYSIRIRNNIVHSVENISPPAKNAPITDGNCIIVDEHRVHSFAGTTLVDNNLCYNNGGRGINVLRGDNVKIINNTLYRNLNSSAMDDDGEVSVVFSHGITVRNNLMVSRSDREEAVVIDSTAVFENNLYGRADAKKKGASDIATGGQLLMDPDKQDFRPLSGSAAVDAGTASDAPSVDLTGRKRSGAPDIGAIEAVN